MYGMAGSPVTSHQATWSTPEHSIWKTQSIILIHTGHFPWYHRSILSFHYFCKFLLYTSIITILLAFTENLNKGKTSYIWQAKWKLTIVRTTPGFWSSGPVVENPSCSAGDPGLIPGQGIKIPHAMGQLYPQLEKPVPHTEDLAQPEKTQNQARKHPWKSLQLPKSVKYMI